VIGMALPIIIRGNFQCNKFRSACENVKAIPLAGIICLYDPNIELIWYV
jgi:hypothetical protein